MLPQRVREGLFNYSLRTNLSPKLAESDKASRLGHPGIALFFKKVLINKVIYKNDVVVFILKMMYTSRDYSI